MQSTRPLEVLPLELHALHPKVSTRCAASSWRSGQPLSPRPAAAASSTRRVGLPPAADAMSVRAAVPLEASAAVPHLDGLRAVAVTRRPALPVDYLSDPRIHFVALAQLQRFVAVALRERSIPGEESRLRREARTLWSAVAFAEQFGIDLEPLLATVGPAPPPESQPTGRSGSTRGAIMPAASPCTAAEPVSPSGSASGRPVHPPEEPARHGPLVVAAALLASSIEQRQRRAAECGQAACYEYPYRPLPPLTTPYRPLQPLPSPHRRPATSTRTAPAATRRARQRGRRERRLSAW